MTSCQLFADDLEALHDGELSREAAAAARRHAASCARCAAELQRLATIASLLRERAEPTVPQGLWDGLAPRLAAVDAALPRGGRAIADRAAPSSPTTRPAMRRRGAVGWRRFLPPLAAAAGLAGLLLLVFGRTPPAQALNVIRSLDTFGAPVLVMPDDAEGATVIWLLDEPGSAAADDAEDRHAPAP